MKKGIDFIGVGVGAVILNEQDEILLLLRRKPPEIGKWSLPGGAVEFFETIEDAIIREVNEELAVDCSVIKLLGVNNHIVYAEKAHWISPIFLVKTEKTLPINKEPQAHLRIGWFRLEKLPDNLSFSTLFAVECLLKKRRAELKSESKRKL